MKKIFNRVGALLSVMLVASCSSAEEQIDYSTQTMQAISSTEDRLIQGIGETDSMDSSSLTYSYEQAYKEFLLNLETDTKDRRNHFAICRYYLYDLDFNNIPELFLYHDSGGSLGRYYSVYYFNGKEIAPIMDSNHLPIRLTDDTKILVNAKNNNILFLKEMYILLGEHNGTYGYLRELEMQGVNEPCVNKILDLTIDDEINAETILNYENHITEDEYLLDDEVDERLITTYFLDGKWNEISSQEYFTLKSNIVTEEYEQIDIRFTNAYYLGSLSERDAFGFKDVILKSEEVDHLLTSWYERNEEIATKDMDSSNDIQEQELAFVYPIPEYEMRQIRLELRGADGGLIAEKEYEKPVFLGETEAEQKMNAVLEAEFAEITFEEDFYQEIVDSYDSHDFYYDRVKSVGTDIYEATCEETYRKGQYISFTDYGFGYGFGAHGFHKKSGFVFDTNTGEQLKITDILDIEPDKMKDILYHEYIKYQREYQSDKAELAESNNNYAESVKEKCGEDAEFWLEENGLVIYFHEYTFAYAYGESYLVIPYTRDDLLKPEFTIKDE